MELATLVRKYLEQAGEFGHPVRLSDLDLPQAELERALAAWDEDYQISRYLLLTCGRDELLGQPSAASVYSINGEEVTHLTLRAGISKLL